MIRVTRKGDLSYEVRGGELPEPVTAVKRPISVRARRMESPFLVETLEGDMVGRAGDWLIEGIRGEMYPCRDDIFQATYRIVAAGNQGSVGLAPAEGGFDGR